MHQKKKIKQAPEYKQTKHHKTITEERGVLLQFGLIPFSWLYIAEFSSETNWSLSGRSSEQPFSYWEET